MSTIMNEKDDVQNVKKSAKKRLRISRSAVAIVAILIVASGISFYFYKKSKTAEDQLNNPDVTSQRVIDEVTKHVGKHIILPNEQPTLATVKDVEKIKSQPFFANAKVGDKVLVFTQARKAILYRPSKDIIVEVAPLNIDTKLN